jgi:lipopolysaccharide biosynthesis glycosyltransferase
MVYDLDGLRENGYSAKWMKFAINNAHRAILPEQEVINLTLGDVIEMLPLNYMAIAEHAAKYDHMSPEFKAANPAWCEMYSAPIQMHYASKIKPWKFPGCSRAELWFDACVKAGMIEVWRKWYACFSNTMVDCELSKRIFEIKAGRFIFKLLKKRRSDA